MIMCTWLQAGRVVASRYSRRCARLSFRGKERMRDFGGGQVRLRELVAGVNRRRELAATP
jgi:hypothetical protein